SRSGSGSTSGSASLTSAERRATHVAVLNGTTRTGLARAVADKVQENQFTIGSVTNNADQSVPTTFVSYTEGHEQAAFAVARIIGIDRGSVQPADANTTAAADADVVVTVGSDQIE
ncbi:MAG: LytR C-terminal domain-containing protein, partial [Solirubrobacteraceae bacterium]